MFDRAPQATMRRLHRASRALAEIVGTLMLVLIVVAAAAAFSIFLAAYESQLLASEKAAHNRSLEDIRILSLATVSNGSDYSSLSFVIGSLDVNTMTVNELSINGEYINYFTTTPLGSPDTTDICALCIPGHGTYVEFNLTSLEQVTIAINLTVWNAASNPTGGFLNPYSIATVGSTNYVAVGVYTTLGNEFTRVFSAPTAVAVTEQSETYTGGVYQPVIVFDGSQSIVPGNDTIVSWLWSIFDGTTLCMGLTGEKALLPQSTLPYGTYTAVLTVGDSNGLVSTASVSYSSSDNASTILACSDQGPNGSHVSLVGAGFPVLSDVNATFGASAINTFTSCTLGTWVSGTTIKSTQSGAFDCAFNVSASTAGEYTIQAKSSPTVANATFELTSPLLSITPGSGPSGGFVSASGTGFTPGYEIHLSISAGGTITYPSFCMVNALGVFANCMFAASGAGPLLYALTATGTDMDPSDAATAPYTIT